ncbi:MAG: SGNH/GDSL hydrolase family protein [Acidobacteriota bacterium]|nr:SGNH/GDSL hydrolase family protein [Acidobacteriota bacterium]
MIFLFVLALLPRIEIAAANDSSVTYRELVPLRVMLDPATHLFHYAGCPDILSGMESVSPGAATLRGYKEHTCVALRKDEYATHVEKRPPRDAALISVLFLGNSLTYFNDMPRMTARIGAQEPRPLFIDAVTLGGADLDDLWYRTDALKRIWQLHWDYVIIQERGGHAAMDRGERFHEGLRRLSDQVRMSGATPVLFMTWYPGNETFFRNAARRAHTLLLPVGSAWKKELDADGTHPNIAGSYLIACTVYSFVYDKPASDTLVLSEGQAAAIQKAAWDAVRRAKNP